MTVAGPKILLVGCGKMGSALLAGWLASDLVDGVTVIEPFGPAAPGDPRIRWLAAPDAAEGHACPDAVVFAVKPQMMEEVAPAYRPYAAQGTLILSIAAGRTIGSFEAIFGPQAPIIRSMPNTPAAIGRGITVCAGNAAVTAAQRGLAETLLGAVGSVAWVEDEALLDAVTAVSGSGPAYVFLLIEALAAAGTEAGLAPDFALRLARETVAGSGELVHRSSESAADLRRNVTSPKGTTEAALAVLMAPDGLEPLMTRAILAAARRSRELAG